MGWSIANAKSIMGIREVKMFTTNAPPTEAAVHDFAVRWTKLLVQENYSGAYEMLCHVPGYPGRSSVSSPDDLRSLIENEGSPTPIPGEPTYKVTEIELAAGERWENYLDVNPVTERYPGYVGRLDWWLPLNGAWSDLQASFDLIEVNKGVAFVLVALRVP
jgi:hypothetical protein